MVGEVIIFCGQECKVLAHKSNYLKVLKIPTFESRIYELTLLPFSKVRWPEYTIENIKIDELW